MVASYFRCSNFPECLYQSIFTIRCHCSWAGLSWRKSAACWRDKTPLVTMRTNTVSNSLTPSINPASSCPYIWPNLCLANSSIRATSKISRPCSKGLRVSIIPSSLAQEINSSTLVRKSSARPNKVPSSIALVSRPGRPKARSIPVPAAAVCKAC